MVIGQRESGSINSEFMAVIYIYSGGKLEATLPK